MYRTIGPLLMLLALFGVGCSSAASELPLPPSTTASVGATTTSEEVESSSQDQVLAEEDARLLAQHVGVYVHTNEEFEASIRHKQEILRRRDEIIAGCMVDRGFEYFPDPPEVVISFYDGFEEERNSREWAAIYGFGITTLRFPAGTLDGRVIGYPGNPPPRPPNSDEESDPFNNYLVSLGEDGQDEYWVALYGTTPKANDFSEENFLAACAGQAEIAIPEFESTDGVQLALIDPIDLLDRAEASPEFLDLEREGARCLGTAGHVFTSEVEARGTIVQLEHEMDQRFGFVNPSALQGTAADDFVEALRQVQAQEIETALAVWECGVAEPQLRVALNELVAKLYQG